ncbi:efflux RND transporter periplasmic adaptor subunit [Derxia gummosa]|uniref:Efflux RND transporter periplasmic adaptor subunit n=1 Tax=Derxia gummosa DSM 723 TaxID=1121388 RepID=A0A8B6X805_9BURK|nr:efflux RND transporter periplasmic adaptor subunit [Derxia gummosa]
MKSIFASLGSTRRRVAVLSVATAFVAGGAIVAFQPHADAVAAAPAAQPAAIPASVAVIEPRAVTLWDDYPGRLEAVQRVELRPRVAGAIQSVHFREGALVAAGDLLFTIDPAPYAAAVARAEAQMASARARLSQATTERDRSRRLWDERAIAERELDASENAARGAEADLRAAEAALQIARLDLGYTQVRAPVAGRVGKVEITVGNLVSAGPDGPVLTTLVSVSPIYASFDVDEPAVTRALAALDGRGAAGATAKTADAARRDTAPQRLAIDRIPVEIAATASAAATITGHLQLIDNQVDARSGTVRVRAVFDNADGALMPGQFARIRLGRPRASEVLLVNERAIGTDQDRKFVLVVDADNHVAHREVVLGAAVGNQRVVERGLVAGDRVVVSGLQRLRPGAEVAPTVVPMDAAPDQAATNTAPRG